MVPFRIRHSMGVWICCFSSLYGQQHGGADDTLAKRFLKEAPDKWRDHARRIAGLEVRCSRTLDVADTKDAAKIVRTVSVVRAVFGNENCQRTFELEPGDSGRFSADFAGCNADYFFGLRKAKGARDYAIAYVESHSTLAQDETLALSRTRFVAERIRRVHLVHMLQLASSPDFKVTSAKELLQGGHHMVQIDFEYNPKKPDNKEVSAGIYRSGTIMCDPAADWAVIEALVKIDDLERKVVVLECESRVDATVRDIPLATSYLVQGKDSKDRQVFRYAEKCEWKEFTGGDDAFRLSGFGFPEPTFPQRSRIRLWGFVLTVAVVVLVTASFVFRIWRTLRPA
ncbi:MAG: hypothetical protein ACLP9L_15820 [Thermoguttaceae bacterium]